MTGRRGTVQIGSGFMALDGARTVTQGDVNNTDAPRKLTVCFQDGSTVSFRYPTAAARDRILMEIAEALGGPPLFGRLGGFHVRLSEVATVKAWDGPERQFHARAHRADGAALAEATFPTGEERDAAVGELLRRLESGP